MPYFSLTQKFHSVNYFCWGHHKATPLPHLFRFYLFAQCCHQLRCITLSPSSASCALADLLLGPGIFFSLKTTETTNMLAMCIPHMQVKREIYDNVIWRLSPKSLLSSAKWACKAEGWPLLQVTDVWYVCYGLTKSLFLHFPCHWGSDSSDNSLVSKSCAACEASRQQKRKVVQLVHLPFKKKGVCQSPFKVK